MRTLVQGCRGSAEPRHPSFPPLLLSLRSLTKASSTLWHQPPQHQCLHSMGLGIRKPWIAMAVLSLVSHETLLNLIFLTCKKNSPNIIYLRWGFSETQCTAFLLARATLYTVADICYCLVPATSLGAASLHRRRSGRSSQGLCSAIFPGNSGNTVVLSLVSTQFASICRNAPISPQDGTWQQQLWNSKYLSTGKGCEFGKGEKTIK